MSDSRSSLHVPFQWDVLGAVERVMLTIVGGVLVFIAAAIGQIIVVAVMTGVSPDVTASNADEDPVVRTVATAALLVGFAIGSVALSVLARVVLDDRTGLGLRPIPTKPAPPHARHAVAWVWLAPLAALSTLGVGLASTALGRLVLGPPSEHLEKIASDVGTAPSLAIVMLTLAVLPAFGEEFLFRGYILRRFAGAMPAVAAILGSAVLFAMIHMDVQQGLMVLPLGLWWGWLAWRTGSVWPAVIGHFTNNAISVLLTRSAEPITGSVESLAAAQWMAGAIGAGAVLALVMLLHGPAAPDE